jgi:hypothetical protein
MKLISCFVNKQQFVRRAVLTCSNASSLVLFTTVLELPLAMALAAAVLLIIDLQLSGEAEERWGGGVSWVRCWGELQQKLPFWRG